jgi:2-(1,2-epoxy-1,2-dihydrophenyl)acetyl-CoA isomerase
MHCDFLIMSQEAHLDSSFSKLGLVADGGANWLLPNLLGYSSALRLILDAERLDAARCLSLGIANKVLPQCDQDREVSVWAKSLAKRASLPQVFSKKLMRAALSGDSLMVILGKEAEAQAACVDSDYFQRAYARLLRK